MLVQIPGEEEIHEAIQSTNASSAPGPDGFTGTFYSVCWNTIKYDLCEAMGAFFKGIQLPAAILATHIMLIPKLKRATTLNQVRPISLYNFFSQFFFQDFEY
ncbi:hypothetical protein QQ045_003232 [Rhodiola kirilowii]